MDNIDKIFKQNLDHFELGNSNDLWNKFEQKKNSKKSYFYSSQLIAIIALVFIALPFSIKEYNGVYNNTKPINNINNNIVLEEYNIQFTENIEEEIEVVSSKKIKSYEYKKPSIVSVNTLDKNNVKEIELEINKVENIVLKEIIKKEENTRATFSLGIDVSADELLAQIDEEKQKGPAELLASRLFKKISEKSKDYISYTKID